MTTSVSDRIAVVGGASSGFDYMRIALAAGVLLWHSYVAAHGKDAGAAYQAGDLGPAIRIILPMFFSLSGFLVASSLERTKSLPVFLSFRALRIVPALAVEVTLSALMIGPLVTTVGAKQYFASPLFHSYFLNIAGDIHYFLPGVFAHNPWPGVVNASLWTVPYELECYFALAAAYCLTLTRRPLAFGGLALAMCVASFLLFRKASVAEMAIDPVPGRMLVLCFMAGVAVFIARRLIPYSTLACLLCGALTVAFLSLPGEQFLAPLPAAYLTVWLGLRNPPKWRLLSSGDYSYGIYLYGFVIQQLVMNSLGRWISSAIPLFFASFVGVALFAFFSWRFVEKPALGLKKVFASKWRSRSLPVLGARAPVDVASGASSRRSPV